MPNQDLQSLRMTPVAWSIYSCKDRTTRTAPISTSCAACRVYSRQESFALRSQKYHDQELRTCLGRLKVNGLLRYRGARRSRGEKPYASQRPIPCKITCSELGKQPQTSSIPIREFDKPGRAVNYSVLRKVKHQKSYDVAVILSTNVRALTNKVDEIQKIAELNSISAICITETWLSPQVPDSCVAIPGYNLFCKDQITIEGGVCIYLDHKVPCKLLESCNQDEVKSIWISMRLHSLPRQITSIVLGVIYHSTSNREAENVTLRQHIQRNLDMLLSDQPNALVIITGDFNHHTTGLKSKDVSQANHLKQLVTFKTRDSGTLDWFFTNRPKLFSVSQLPKVASSDHYTILARPMISSEHKPVIKKIESRDMRDSAWRALGR